MNPDSASLSWAYEAQAQEPEMWQDLPALILDSKQRAVETGFPPHHSVLGYIQSLLLKPGHVFGI